jgi:hypothetical protein
LKFYILAFFVLWSSLVFGQSDVLLTNGKVRKVFVYNIDYFHVRYAKSEKKELDMTVLEARTQELESKFVSDIYKVDLKFKEKLAIFKETNPIKEDEESYTTNLKVKQAVKEESLRRRKEIAIAKLRYNRLRKVRKELVFSVTTDGVEQVVYSPDTLGFLDSSKVEVEYNVAEMRRYIKGEQDGRKVKAPWAIVGGVGIGAIGGIGGAFWGPIIPATYVVLVAVKKKSKQIERQVPKPELLDDEAYRDGFNKTAKRRRVANAVYGSVAGLAVGIGTYLYLFRIK